MRCDVKRTVNLVVTVRIVYPIVQHFRLRIVPEKAVRRDIAKVCICWGKNYSFYFLFRSFSEQP